MGHSTNERSVIHPTYIISHQVQDLVPVCMAPLLCFETSIFRKQTELTYIFLTIWNLISFSDWQSFSKHVTPHSQSQRVFLNAHCCKSPHGFVIPSIPSEDSLNTGTLFLLKIVVTSPNHVSEKPKLRSKAVLPVKSKQGMNLFRTN